MDAVNGKEVEAEFLSNEKESLNWPSRAKFLRYHQQAL